jgi:hypothetical protein
MYAENVIWSFNLSWVFQSNINQVYFFAEELFLDDSFKIRKSPIKDKYGDGREYVAKKIIKCEEIHVRLTGSHGHQHMYVL